LLPAVPSPFQNRIVTLAAVSESLRSASIRAALNIGTSIGAYAGAAFIAAALGGVGQPRRRRLRRSQARARDPGASTNVARQLWRSESPATSTHTDAEATRTGS